MSIFKKLTEKSWLAQSGADGTAIAYRPGVPAKTALSFFICVVTILFFLFTITYLSRSQYADFQALAGEPWLPLAQPNLLWLNTFWLALASLFLHLSGRQAIKERISYPLAFLTLGVIFSLIFVFGQWRVWQQLSQLGFVINSNPANSYFYVLTAIHALHVLGGLLALARVVVLLSLRGSLVHSHQSLVLCAWYWHYLLLLWLFLFALLTASPSTYSTIAAWCGL